MALHRKKEPAEFLFEIIPEAGGLVVVAVLFVPQFREVLGDSVALCATTAGAALVFGLGLLFWKKRNLAIAELSAAVAIHSNATFTLDAPISRLLEPIGATWTLELLRSLDAKVFVDLIVAFAKEVGQVGEMTCQRTAGGISVRSYTANNPHPVMIVHCKARESRPVGVEPIRKLYGVMAAEEIKEGAFFTTDTFTPDALEFAKGKPLDLVNGAQFLTRIRQLPASAQSDLLEFATLRNDTTPLWPSSETK